MKKTFIILFVLTIIFPIAAQVDPTLVDIPYHVFIGEAQDDFDNILWKENSIREKVKTLHSYDELTHEFTVTTNSFEEYWKNYSSQWHYIRFKENAEPVLIFFGFKNFNDELEYVEIYDVSKKRNERLLFSEVGKLLAYKVNPHNQELVLFTHKYPCCRSASHNIFKIRQLNGTLQVSDRFFVGRDAGDMVGPFFPETAIHKKEYHVLTKRTELRWSPAVVEKDAFLGWTHSNLIIHYNEGALYKILNDAGDWLFVLFFNGIAEEQSSVLNYTNFTNKGVYGWIKK